jgi:glycosyltransferase involved in cell wall biosynthesis
VPPGALISRLKSTRLVRSIARSKAGGIAKRIRAVVERTVGLRRQPCSQPQPWKRVYTLPETGDPANYGPVAVISLDPPILKTGIAFAEWLGIAGAFGRRFGDWPAGFLIFPTWSNEAPERIAAIAHAASEHRRRYPSHRLVFMGNTQREAALLKAAGVPALFLNTNLTVSDAIFRPLDGAEPEFDAIYNARFAPEKRHELAASIDSLAYLGYIAFTAGWEEQAAAMRRLVDKNPHHVLLNPIVDGLPVRFSPAETNQQLNRARIGLCLSEVEGQNYASMEYLLAGLGVVSTPSKGGRDVYFDPEFCIVCEPRPEAVRDAVAALKARNVPRRHIRKVTLARIEAERRRFLDLIDDMRADLGGPRRRSKRWMFAEVSGMVQWDGFDVHLDALEQASKAVEARAQSQALAEVAAFGAADIQLQRDELLPIVRAILAVSGCRLLVFGCGNDSPLREKINQGGTTAFLEDEPEWVSAARSRLTSSIVEQVQYRTRVADWRAQLDAGDALLLDLPDSIMRRRWDVILVDGPAGNEDHLPGRAQSIVTARRLVAPSGKIFVHDCDRPLERAFCARYLGEHRRFVSATGRALLNGYSF